MFCEKCGEEISEGAKFCEKCGAPVESETQESKEDVSYKKQLLGGVIGGIVVLTVVVVSLFATGILGTKKESVQTSNGTKSDMVASDPTAQPTEEAADAATDSSAPASEPTEAPVEEEANEPDVQPDDAAPENNVVESENPDSQTSNISVDSVVEHAREVYYSIADNPEQYEKHHFKGESTEYYDGQNIVKAVTYPTTTNRDYSIEKYTTEYYYDSDGDQVFAFAYRKVKGKTKEYRAYYGKDGKLYRYIGNDSKIHDYKKGKQIKAESTDLKYALYSKGVAYWMLAMAGADENQP